MTAQNAAEASIDADRPFIEIDDLATLSAVGCGGEQPIRINVEIDVAKVLSTCATRTNALAYLQGVADIFAPLVTP